MPRRRPLVAFEITPELKEGLDSIKERDGVPISEQIRRAISMWLVEKGVGKVAKGQSGKAIQRKTRVAR